MSEIMTDLIRKFGFHLVMVTKWWVDDTLQSTYTWCHDRASTFYLL